LRPVPRPLDPDIAAHPLIGEARARAPITRFVQGMPDLTHTPENVELIRQVYLGLAAEVDHHIGRVIRFLKDSGQYDDTLIILCSDHGEMLGDHDSWGKSTVFDAAFHVPLIIRDPSLEGTGRIIDAPVEITDIFPTLLEFAGLDLPTSVDGRSLYPLMRGQAPDDWRNYTWTELDFGQIPSVEDGHPSNMLNLEQCNLCILREQHLTLVHFNASVPAMLFDHRRAGEAQNLADDPAYAPDMLRMLDHRMTHANATLSSYSNTKDGVIRA